MGGTGYDREQSSFEDLDPPPPTLPGRSGQRRELLLGGCLVVVVFLFAGWNWWQDETQAAIRRAAYHAGQVAATARDWDTARTQFLAAGPYADAPVQAAAAANQITERNKQYMAALTALAARDGVTALQALDLLDKIEEGYGGAALLRSGAHAQLYRSALEGIVARRREATPPGLYYRTAADWVWLAGSDAASSLHTSSNTDVLVYDTPATASGSDAAGVNPPAGPPPTARRLTAARISGGSLSFLPLALAPGAGVFWGTGGGWRYTYGCKGSVPSTLRSYYCLDGMVYSAAGSTLTTTVTLPGPDWLVLDLARDGSAMLVAQTTAGASAAPRSTIYRAAPDGSNLQMLYEDAGWLARAAFSPDSHSVLVTLGVSGEGERTNYKAVLLDAAGQAVPRVLGTVRDPNTGAPVGLDFVLLGGTGPAQAALVQYSNGQTQVALVPLRSPPGDGAPRLVSLPFQAPYMVQPLDDGTVLLCGQTREVSFALDRLSSDGGECALVDGTAQETPFLMPSIARYGIGYAWPRQGSMIYPIAVPQGGVAQMSVLRIPTTLTGPNVPQSAVILQLSLGVGERLDLAAGEGLLAYARQGQLHIRTYDGSFDMVLEQGIDALYDVRNGALLQIF